MGDQDDSLNEDQWLYGDGPGAGRLPETNGLPSKTEPAIPGVSPEPIPPAEGPLDPLPPGIQREDGEEDGELPVPPGEEELSPPGMDDPAPPGKEGSPKEEGEEDDDDDDSDDDIRVTIGNIKTAPPAPYTGINKMRGAVLSSGLDKLSKPGKFSIDEFESIGSINGMPAHEFSIDALEDKPWRKPGADITDYFNYGFNEDTWRAYCERQKALRVQESGVGLGGLGVPRNPVPINVMSDTKYSGGAMPPSMGVPPPVIPVKPIGGGPMGQMQGARRPSGVIDVIGGGIASRRTTDSPPKENVIQVMTSERRDFRKSFDMTVPPPGFDAPPPGVAPPIIPGYPPYGGDYHYGGDVDYYPSNFEPTQEMQSWGSEGGSTAKDVLPGGITIKEEPIDKGYKEKEKDRERDRDRDRSERHKEKERSHRHRSRSRSTERDRRSSRKHKSRSRSPGHRSHKKKKSKKSDKRDTGSD